MTDAPLVVVRTFLNHVEADLARSVLEAAEIDSTVRADDCGGVRPHLWMGGVQVLVDEADVAQAEAVLSELMTELPADSEPPAGE